MEKFKTKELALIAVFSATWIGYTFLSSMAIGQIAKGIDVHVVRSVLLVLIVAMIGRFGGATWMTTIVGIFYLSSRTPYPPVIITIATIASGLAYDIYVKITGYQNATNWKVFSIGVLIAGLVQSVSTLGLLTVLNFFPARAIEAAWIAGLTKNVTASIVAIVITVAIVKRVVPIYKNYG
ncbi:hypothetical protein E4H04_10500 [Candidatus Bathyarchaeota archaeon]|jgi:hypothetical protein|nr:MAG: hypothetical protein E4H04_10500 [Candidatus Bathyarchaeota archaeon]